MNRTLLATLTASILTVSASSHADDVEGATCQTSDDCGDLKCIEDRCRDVTHIVREHRVSVGDRGMFGDGEGYGSLIAGVDVTAVVSEPFLMAVTVSSMGSTASVMGVICFVPVGFAGPIVHLTHGRFGPAAISFFAWTSLAGTTFVVGGLFGLAFQNGNEFNSPAAWAGGLLFGAAGAAALTYLDIWMARTVRPSIKSTSSFNLAPGISPLRGGALATIGGQF